MAFSVSIDGIEWSLDFGPASLTLTVTDLVEEMTISLQKFALAAWSLLLAQRRHFLNINLAGVSYTHNQEGTMEMRDEVLSTVGAPDRDTSGYQVSDLDDFEFYWVNDQLDGDVAFKPDIDTPI